MEKGKNDRRVFLMAWGVLLLVGVFFAVRSLQVASAVFANQPRARGAAAAEPAEGAAGADSLPVMSFTSTVSTCDRNPFAEPAARRVAVTEPVFRSEAKPVARFLMVDSSDRVVQIAVGDSLSPRLHVGDRFLGWSVISIHPSSVTVSKAGKSVVLSSP